MANVWGVEPDEDFNRKCSRCAEVECICGDPAFEAWVEEELSEVEAREDARR